MTIRPPLATPDEVAAYLGVPRKTLYKWRINGDGPKASKIGRHLRYAWADVDAWAQTRQDGAA